MDKVKELRERILAEVAEYAALTAGNGDFVPGKSRVNYAGRCYDAAEMVNLADAALEFWLTAGRFSAEFERSLAQLIGVDHALLVNSGSSANLLAFMTLTDRSLGDRRIRRGDEVITVACGFPTTVAPILQYGAVPVFIDVEAEGVNLDPAQLEAALSPRTKAVFAAHTLGNPFDLDAVTEFCRRHGLWLIEDNCDALGSRWRGAVTGSFGDIATSSFYPPHHLTMGEGGAVYMRDAQLYRIARSLRDWGRDCCCETGQDNRCGHRFSGEFGTLPRGYDHKYVYSRFGYNLKATDLQAAIGCAQLKKLAAFTAARRRNHARLVAELEENREVAFMRALPAAEPAWFGCFLHLTEAAEFTRNDFAEALEAAGIQTRNLFAGNLVRHPCFDGLTVGVDYRVAAPLAVTDRMMERGIWFGVYPGLDDARLRYMIDTIRKFLHDKRTK